MSVSCFSLSVERGLFFSDCRDLLVFFWMAADTLKLLPLSERVGIARMKSENKNHEIQF